MAKRIKKNITSDTLAGMIKRGFDENIREHRQIFQKFDKVDTKLENLGDGVEEIKLKLDQVSYRFEIQKLAR